MVAQRERVTLADFERLIALPENADRLLELIHGEVVEKVPTEQHGEVVLTLGGAMRAHATVHKLGRVTTEARHQMPGDNENVRLPNISFIAGKHPPVEQGSVLQMPDLAVEVKSPGDKLRELRGKALYYLTNGTRLVWIVDPRKRIVTVLTADDEENLVDGDTLSGGDVLPGFGIAVSAIFADPLGV